MKKYILGVLLAAVLVMGGSVATAKVASAKELSIRDLINLLILIDVIPESKRAAVNAFLASIDDNGNDHPVVIDNGRVGSEWTAEEGRRAYNDLPDISADLENKLRGPAVHEVAARACKAEGKRLPNWNEVISKKVNPTKFLTKYGDASQRLWTNVNCAPGHYATAWKGIPNWVKDALDIRAKDSWNNCTQDYAPQYYQCVDDDSVSEENLTPSLKVTYPDGGENLKTGVSYKIKWNSENLGDSKVNIDLIRYEDSGRQGSVTSIAHSVANTGYYSWKDITPTTDPNVPNLKILITSVTNPSVKDYSNDYFTVSCTAPYTWGGYGTACVLGDDSEEEDSDDSDPITISNDFTFIAFWNAIQGVPEGTYYDPRLLVSGSNGTVPSDMVPVDDSASATKWCKLIGGKNYTNGTAQGDAPVEVGKRVRFNGSNWIFGETNISGNYSRAYFCN